MSVVMSHADLVGKTISLIKLDSKFIHDMFEYSKMPKFYYYMELPPIQTMEGMKEYLEKIFNRIRKGTAIYWAIVLDNKMIGTFGVTDINSNAKSAQVGYGISPDYWWKGYFTQALSLVLEHCFVTMELNRISAVTETGNKGSIGGLRNLGFVQEGVLRQYYRKLDGTYRDAVLLSILKEDYCG